MEENVKGLNIKITSLVILEDRVEPKAFIVHISTI